MTTDAITDLDALPLSRAIHAREVSCVEVMRAYLARIHRLNPRFNAIVNLAPDDVLLAQADERDAELARGASRGWLHGMPQAIKDVGAAVGLPHHLRLPAAERRDGARRQRSWSSAMKAAGCIVIGKTNMPEFGLGSHTYNNLFGTTGNAWDPSVSAGGSSGGAAVALAQRLLPVADGSDFMGSLRNPAGWNHVFGMRPSQGRVPCWPTSDVWVRQLATEGPMGRTVRDLAQLLSTQAGYDPRAPLVDRAGAVRVSCPGPGPSVRGQRIGWLGDLGGYLAIERGVLDVCARRAAPHEPQRAVVEPLTSLGFDLDRLWEAWLLWRRALVAPSVGALMTTPARTRTGQARGAMGVRPGAIGEPCGLHARQRDALAARMPHCCSLFERFDALALPVAQVWPFPVTEHWPRTIDGRTMDTYHRWMEVTIYATFAGLPAISVPAGFHANGGWPMGLQLIGRPQGDAALLELAAGYEALIPDLLARRPPEPAAD